MFAKHGRAQGCGTSMNMIYGVLKELNIISEPDVNLHAKTVLTLERELPKKGRFLVWTKCHVLAAIDGEILDFTKGRRHRVKYVEKIYF